jgi:hypothetical protein
MKTKKLLVPYDEKKPKSGRGDFLAVILNEDTPQLYGLKSRRIHPFGKMCYLGTEISEKDVFARLVDSKRKIANVAQTIALLAAYVEQLAGFKIGNILKIEACAESPGFRLVKVAEMPKVEPIELP